jgi:hypothetical protein
MIPPPPQRAMAKRAGATVVEAHGSHAVYVSSPSDVAKLIEAAASPSRLCEKAKDRGPPRWGRPVPRSRRFGTDLSDIYDQFYDGQA